MPAMVVTLSIHVVRNKPKLLDQRVKSFAYAAGRLGDGSRLCTSSSVTWSTNLSTGQGRGGVDSKT